MEAVRSLFANLWSDYTSFNPQAKRIYDKILERERQNDPSVQELVNDHIALRTYDVAPMGLSALAAIFEKYGYQARGQYRFKEKKLFARHYEHEDERMPKVFISELVTKELSPEVRKAAAHAAETVASMDLKADSLLWKGRPWTASHATYQKLLAESEYAAWMYAFGFRCNHFTISFNSLKTFRDLSELNDFVRSCGYSLNGSGGEIKGTPTQFLEQSSTLAEKAKISFEDGLHEIPSCYYEFARRYPLPDGRMFQGFIEGSADKIFESTNVRR